ncbi:MAG TPA: peptidoglycan-associated lipoprotein Pal [Sphingomonadales bacterium]|nr:peptidoglycan-associated lipoprotein Pal [Sphingomonadales bacterium]
MFETKFKKLMLVSGVALLFAACAKKEEPVVTTPPPAPTVPSEPVERGPIPGSQEDLAATAGDRVFFDFDSSELDATDRATLQQQAAWLNQYPNVRIAIEGHCDERGTREYNLALGDRRAAAVKNYLVALGISASRIDTISYGKERPVAFGSTETAWAQNRRGVSMVNP